MDRMFARTFAADILGMLVGYLLKSKTPDGLLNTLAFAIFSIFGVYTLYQGLKLIRTSVCPIPVWPVLIAVTVIFAALCVCLFIRREKKKNIKYSVFGKITCGRCETGERLRRKPSGHSSGYSIAQSEWNRDFFYK